MTHAERIILVESALATAGVSVSEVCRRAGLDRATWHRWKRDGDQPRPATWAKVEEVLRAVAPDTLPAIQHKEAA